MYFLFAVRRSYLFMVWHGCMRRCYLWPAVLYVRYKDTSADFRACIRFFKSMHAHMPIRLQILHCKGWNSHQIFRKILYKCNFSYRFAADAQQKRKWNFSALKTYQKAGFTLCLKPAIHRYKVFNGWWTVPTLDDGEKKKLGMCDFLPLEEFHTESWCILCQNLHEISLCGQGFTSVT